MRRIPTLEYLLLGTHGRLWSRLIMPDIQCCYLSWARPHLLFLVLKALGCGCWGLGYTPSRVMKMIHIGPTGGEILLVHTYRDEMEEWVGPESNSF
jgi:hypothetical protein